MGSRERESREEYLRRQRLGWICFVVIFGGMGLLSIYGNLML